MPMMAMLTVGLVALPVVPLAAQSASAPADAPAGLEGDEDAIFAAAVEATRQRDFAQAYDLFEALAEADVADAQFNLAVLVRQGRVGRKTIARHFFGRGCRIWAMNRAPRRWPAS